MTPYSYHSTELFHQIYLNSIWIKRCLSDIKIPSCVKGFSAQTLFSPKLKSRSSLKKGTAGGGYDDPFARSPRSLCWSPRIPPPAVMALHRHPFTLEYQSFHLHCHLSSQPVRPLERAQRDQRPLCIQSQTVHQKFCRETGPFLADWLANPFPHFRIDVIPQSIT